MKPERGKIPDSESRVERILADAEKYFAEATERHREDILRENRAKSVGSLRRRPA